MIKNVTDFGAFVDLGGVDGLLHISEMSWGRIDNPKKNFHVGDTLTVLVKDIHDTKVALSLKFPETNPWANASENFAVGTVITGKELIYDLKTNSLSVVLSDTACPMLRSNLPKI